MQAKAQLRGRKRKFMAMADYEVLDDRFGGCIAGAARVEKLYEGCRWAEGPVYFGAGRYLVWSDIPNDRMLRFDEATGAVGTFRQPAGYSNGNTLDRQGRLVSCHHGYRTVTRTEHDGTLTTIAERFDGKRFNSPNDVVVRSDDSIWFTDPAYGIDSDYEGHKGESEIGRCNVYRIDPANGEITIVADDFERPNGLAFSVDESRLYLTDTGAAQRHCRVFDVHDDRTLSGGEVFATATNGGFDGFRFDTDGRIWMSAGDGVHCLAADGELIGKVLLPEGCANLTFGGAKRNRLYMCATTSLYSVMVKVNGAKTF